MMLAKFPEHIAIEKKLPEAVHDWHADFGDRTMIVAGEHIASICKLLRDELGYNMLVDLTCVDYLPRRPRFEVVYHLMNLDTKSRLRLKVLSDEKIPVIPTLTELWPIADWLEREVWDLFGVKFEGHPNLKRLLLYEGFQGHPLRKDYPKTKRQPLVGPQN
jgi:NADH-quinone oxidoreductase subunit C